MEQQLCVLACSAMGETGALIFALLAFVWGLYQRRAKVASDAKVTDLDAQRATLESERAKLEAEVKLLSLRPPPVPIIITAPSSPTPEPPATPPPVPSDEPQPDETLG